MRTIIGEETMEIVDWVFTYRGLWDVDSRPPKSMYEEIRKFISDENRTSMDCGEEFYIFGFVLRRPGFEDRTEIKTSFVTKIEKVRLNGRRAKVLLATTRSGSSYMLQLNEQLLLKSGGGESDFPAFE